jgi:hypothetical protein
LTVINKGFGCLFSTFLYLLHFSKGTKYHKWWITTVHQKQGLWTTDSIVCGVLICKEKHILVATKKLVYSSAKRYEKASMQAFSSSTVSGVGANICSANWVLYSHWHFWKFSDLFLFMLSFALIFEFSCIFQVWMWWFLSGQEMHLFQRITVSRQSPPSLKSDGRYVCNFYHAKFGLEIWKQICTCVIANVWNAFHNAHINKNVAFKRKCGCFLCNLPVLCIVIWTTHFSLNWRACLHNQTLFQLRKTDLEVQLRS